MENQPVLAREEDVRDAISADRDLTIPWWVDMHCPGCGAVIDQVNANFANKIWYDTYTHECGYAGRLDWINPYPPAAVWAARWARGMTPSVHDHSMDSLSGNPEISPD